MRFHFVHFMSTWRFQLLCHRCISNLQCVRARQLGNDLLNRRAATAFQVGFRLCCSTWRLMVAVETGMPSRPRMTAKPIDRELISKAHFEFTFQYGNPLGYDKFRTSLACRKASRTKTVNSQFRKFLDLTTSAQFGESLIRSFGELSSYE